MAEEHRDEKRLSLSTQVFIGLGLGLVTGIFFGEMVTPVKSVGDAFVRLLQMTVLPQPVRG